VSATRHFTSELMKLAFRVKNVPKISTSSAPLTTRTGAGVAMPATKPFMPSVKPVGGVKGPKSSVPTASGSNLGTSFAPRTKTVPAVTSGGSLVR